MAKKTKAAVKEKARAALEEFVEATWEEPDEPKADPDEFADALRGLVLTAEAAGQRDNPAVAHARELLVRHGKLK